MTARSRAVLQDQIDVRTAPLTALLQKDFLDSVPFLAEDAAFTGTPTIGGVGIVTGPNTPVARTATADGTGLGTIAAAGMLQLVAVTATDANHWVVLPPPVIGKIVILMEVSTVGYEIRSSTPASIGINGGVGAAAESAVPASSTVVLICETLTNWKGFMMHTTAGTLAKVEVAA